MSRPTRHERRERRAARRRYRTFQRLVAAADPTLREELLLMGQRAHVR